MCSPIQLFALFAICIIPIAISLCLCWFLFFAKEERKVAGHMALKIFAVGAAVMLTVMTFNLSNSLSNLCS